MGLKFNPFTGTLDVDSSLDPTAYVEVTGDTMTGALTITDAGININTSSSTETSPLKFGPAGFSNMRIYQRSSILVIGAGSGTTNRSLGFAGGSDILVYATGDLYPVTDSSVDLGRTGNRWLKVWTDDIESSSMPTVNGTSLNNTFLQVAGDTMEGTLNFATTSPTPTSGDMWFDGSALNFQPAADKRSVSLANGVIIADTTIANTTTETTIYTESVSAAEFYKGSK